MNYRNVIKVIGGLLLLVGSCQAICMLFSWLDPEQLEEQRTVRAFLISTLLSIGIGALGIWLGRRTSRDLLRKEAITVVGLGWIICAAFGAIPYLLIEPGLSIVDSLFESMSGFTTTGASVLADLEIMPRGILLWRALTQWLGGMGILVLFVALLSSFRIGSRAIFRHESSAQDTRGIGTNSRDIALQLWFIYLALSLICFAGLKLLGLSFFDAICHTFATVSTGGFGTHNESIGYFNSQAVEIWITLFMIICSINFILYAWLLKRGWQRWKQDEESKVFLAILFLATLVVAVDLTWVGGDTSTSHAFRVAAFQVVSLMTTTGFVTADFGTWPPLSDQILLMLMVIGGCAGSTAGGVKLSRWILFVKSIKLQITSSFRPARVMQISLNGRHTSDALRIDTLFLVGLAGIITAVGAILVSLMEPSLDMDSNVTAVLATLFNIGPGLGKVGPTHNFSELAPYTKVLLTMLMAVGRLEFYAILALFLPSLWKNY